MRAPVPVSRAAPAAPAEGGSLSNEAGGFFGRSRFRPRVAAVLLFAVATTAAASESPVHWTWSGAVTTDSAVVKAKVETSAGPPRLILGERAVEPESLSAGGVAVFRLEGLEPGTEHVYRVAVEGHPALEGRFRTFDDGPMSFRFVFASCARTGSNSSVFETIESLEPSFVLHMGDLHYEDIAENDVARFRTAFDDVLSSERQSSLYRSAPIVYVWDDHDYGPNDADRTHRGRPAALRAYDESVPHYPLARDDAGTPLDVRQAFSAGRLRFIVTDVRSNRAPEDGTDGPEKTLLGVSQREWLLHELEAAKDGYELVVWANVVPWIVKAGSGHGWGRYAWERGLIADRIRELGLADRLLMISGDAHMVAMDDGTHSNYSTGAGGREPAFPVVHAAPFDQRPSKKGGPYSHGTSARKVLFGLVPIQQFGLADVRDDGEVLEVDLTGRDKKGRLLKGMALRLRCRDGCEVVPRPHGTGSGAEGR